MDRLKTEKPRPSDGRRARAPWLTVMVTAMTWAMIGWITFGMPADAAGSRDRLVLSALFDEAFQCSPAFMAARDLEAMQSLAQREEELQHYPSGRVDVAFDAYRPVTTGLPGTGPATNQHLDTSTQGMLTVTWPVTDDMTISAVKQLGDRAGSPGLGSAPRDFVQVEWNRMLWPADSKEPTTDHIDRLNVLGARFQAERAVIATFYQAKRVVNDAIIAGESVNIAQRRFERAGLRFDAGDMSVTEWRMEQDRLAEAEDRARTADRARHESLLDLAEVIGGSCGAKPVAGNDEFVDDLPWNVYVMRVLSLLDAQTVGVAGENTRGKVTVDDPGALMVPVSTLRKEIDNPLMLALMESFDPAYQRALMSLQESIIAAKVASEAGLPKVFGRANIVQPLSGQGGQQDLQWSAGIGVSLDLRMTNSLRHERADIAKSAAERDVDTALRRVHREGVSALNSIGDAQDALETARLSYARVEETAEIVRLRVEAGFLTDLDLTEAQLSLDHARMRLEQAFDDLKLAWIEFGFKLGLLPTDVMM